MVPVKDFLDVLDTVLMDVGDLFDIIYEEGVEAVENAEF